MCSIFGIRFSFSSSLATRSTIWVCSVSVVSLLFNELLLNFPFSTDDSEVEDHSTSKCRASSGDRYSSSFVPKLYSVGL